MFDKLIDLIVTFIHDILPWKIVDQWEKGVHLRTGNFLKVVNPGLNWKIPFFDQILTTPVITQTVNLSPQTVTSVDEKSVVLSSIVRYHIHDVEKFLLGVMHANDVLVDTTQGIIRDVVEGSKWTDLYDLLIQHRVLFVMLLREVNGLTFMIWEVWSLLKLMNRLKSGVSLSNRLASLTLV